MNRVSTCPCIGKAYHCILAAAVHKAKHDIAVSHLGARSEAHTHIAWGRGREGEQAVEQGKRETNEGGMTEGVRLPARE